MKRSKKIILITLSLLVLDLILTLYFINNYNHLVSEGNPLVLVDNGIWVIVVNLVYLVIIIFLVRALDKYETIYLKSNSVFDYIKKLYKSDHYKFILISVIFSFVYATIISRLIVVIDWLIFGIYKSNFFHTTYYLVRKQMPLYRYDILLGLCSFFVCIPLWYILEYRKVKEKING